jgi:thiamine biosynthesis protein ThiS
MPRLTLRRAQGQSIGYPAFSWLGADGLTRRLGVSYDASTRFGTMQVQVNGEQRTLEAGLTVTGLLRELDIRPDRVAVELNLTILDRGEFDRRRLQEGDRVEIISFIGGGTGQRA